MAPSKRKAPAQAPRVLDSGYDVTFVYDTETTGLLKPNVADLEQQPKIIEFALCEINRKYEIVRDHVWLIYPGEDITAEITKITGLTNDDLRGKPRFMEVLPQISQVMRRADRIVAHNAPFDQGMLVNELKRVGMEHRFPYPAEWVCTVQLAQELVYGRRAKMTELYADSVGKPLEQTHRALDDVHALVEILRAREW
jgi:DNA polymerase-3 subunit epsilon